MDSASLLAMSKEGWQPDIQRLLLADRAVELVAADCPSLYLDLEVILEV